MKGFNSVEQKWNRSTLNMRHFHRSPDDSAPLSLRPDGVPPSFIVFCVISWRLVRTWADLRFPARTQQAGFWSEPDAAEQACFIRPTVPSNCCRASSVMKTHQSPTFSKNLETIRLNPEAKQRNSSQKHKKFQSSFYCKHLSEPEILSTRHRSVSVSN